MHCTMKILIVCFSSVSNVACIVPQLFGLVRRYPEHEFTVLSRNFLEPLFSSLPVRFEGADIRKEDYGLAGAFRIYRRLVNKGYDVVIDMQDHWRSHIITSLLKAKGSKRYVISSERGALRKLVSKGAAASNPIKTIFERQADVWKKVGLQTDDSFVMLPPASEDKRKLVHDMYGEKRGAWIGIAPLSSSKGKELPFKKMKSIISHFDAKPDTTIFLFGAGEFEKEMLSDWQSMYNNVHAVYTRLKLDEELALMGELDVMLSLDSANVHLASLAGIPVVSVWGQTHPYGGFAGWKQSADNCIGVDMPCRPCSVRGDKECRFGDFRCLERIDTAVVIARIEEIIGKGEVGHNMPDAV